jgi:hypothetical protein
LKLVFKQIYVHPRTGPLADTFCSSRLQKTPKPWQTESGARHLSHPFWLASLARPAWLAWLAWPPWSPWLAWLPWLAWSPWPVALPGLAGLAGFWLRWLGWLGCLGWLGWLGWLGGLRWLGLLGWLGWIRQSESLILVRGLWNSYSHHTYRKYAPKR